MTHTPTLVALIAALFFTPTILASHHGEVSDMSLDAAKQQIKDKGGKAISDKAKSSEMTKYEGKIKDKAAKMDQEVPCSDSGQEHGKCDEIHKKMGGDKHEKNKGMKEVKSNKNMF